MWVVHTDFIPDLETDGHVDLQGKFDEINTEQDGIEDLGDKSVGAGSGQRLFFGI